LNHTEIFVQNYPINKPINLLFIDNTII